MDSDSDSNSSEGESDYTIPYLFKSALDVGSRFVDIVPDNELVFIKQLEGTNQVPTLFTQLTIRNVNTRSPIAFFVRILFSYRHKCIWTLNNVINRCSHLLHILFRSCLSRVSYCLSSNR